MSLGLAAPVPQLERTSSSRSRRARLLALLSDCGWHHHAELLVGGNRYNARMGELRADGYEIESRELHTESGKEYRLRSLERGPERVRRVKPFLLADDARFLLTVPMLPATARQALADAIESFERNQGRR